MAEVIILPDARAAGELVADAIATLVARRPEAVLGLATGSTPLPVYEALRSRLGGADVSRVRGFALDEYVGLDPAHPQSYRSVIAREVVEPLGLDPSRIRTPDGRLEGIEDAGDEYEAAIAAAGGIDLQLLGIGTDGHIAFNEPGSSLASRTRIKTLTSQTRADNARFFGGDPDAVPQHCLTQGVGTIRDARQVVLVADGRRKAEAVHQLVEGPVSAMWPATALQLHPHVTVVLDPPAASRLQLAGYFRETRAAKPAWQGL